MLTHSLPNMSLVGMIVFVVITKHTA